jgi:hypothetical protein
VITHYEATVTLLGVILGMLTTLVAVVWRARGYVDRLNTTDGNLAKAIDDLARTQKELHTENQRRFAAIERRLRMSS